MRERERGVVTRAWRCVVPSCRARAPPAPIPTPATTRPTAAAPKMEKAAPTPATLRRSQRTAARKAAAPVVEEVTATKTTTRRSARSKVMVDLEQEVEDMAVALQEVKVQGEDPKGEGDCYAFSDQIICFVRLLG